MNNTKSVESAYASVAEFERQLTLALDFSERKDTPLADKQFLSHIQSNYDEFGWTLQLTDHDRLRLRRLSEGLR